MRQLKWIAMLLVCSTALATGAFAQATETVPAKPSPEQKPPPKQPEPTGWNGDHFFIQAGDNQFVLQPYAYVQTDFRVFAGGEGVPPNTFNIRRARLGLQGKLNKYYEFAFLADFADTNSTLLRDAYVNVNYIRDLQVTVGQFTEPFGQEVASVGVTNIDFVERGLQSLLYPAASGAFRSPGAMVHGDIIGGTISYYLGAFNGKGPLQNNTTSEPEVIGRLRLYPFKASNNDWLKGLAFGGAFGRGRSRGLSNEQSFGTGGADRPFTLVPQTPINGPIQRYNLEATLVTGPLGLRGEYDELHQQRYALDVGFTNLQRVRGRAWNFDATFLLTGERRPENGQPKATHPFLDPVTGGVGPGAIEIKGRYSWLSMDAPGDIANGFPDLGNTVDEISFGGNWYPTNLVRYSLDFNIYRLKDAASVQGQVPQNFLVVLQRVQFKF